jgi:spermidine synthase
MQDERFSERVLPTARAAVAVGRFLELGPANWFLDVHSHSRLSLIGGNEVCCSLQTLYQRLDVVRLEEFGLCMILDGRIQLAESDEWIYHELLIHPACVLHGDPRRALVLGGGDGCTVRELLRYAQMEEIILVDIDRSVVDLFRSRFASVNGGALDDPRVRVLCQDALDYLKVDGTHYDLIISDLTEPFDTSGLAGDLSSHLYGPDFYGLLEERLTPQGIFACQTGGILCQEKHDRHHRDLMAGIRARFPHVAPCYEFVPSFGELWGIALASRVPLDIPAAEVDEVLAGLGVRGLRYYDGISHERAFRAPRFLRETRE